MVSSMLEVSDVERAPAYGLRSLSIGALAVVGEVRA